jgi:hypothetical protein
VYLPHPSVETLLGFDTPLLRTCSIRHNFLTLHILAHIVLSPSISVPPLNNTKPASHLLHSSFPFYGASEYTKSGDTRYPICSLDLICLLLVDADVLLDPGGGD